MRTPRLAAALLVGVLLAGVGGSAALAQGPPLGGGRREGGMRRGAGRGEGELALMIRAADLTPEQQTRVREILSAHRAAARPVVEQLRGAQAELGDKLLAPGSVQAADLQPLLQRIGQLRDQLARDSAAAALEVRAVLTPEQLARVARTKARLSELREEMRHLMQPPRR